MLGWDNTLQGHLSMKRAKTQRIHLRTQDIRKDLSNHPSVYCIIQALWEAADKMWKRRNKMEYDRTKDERSLNCRRRE